MSVDQPLSVASFKKGLVAVGKRVKDARQGKGMTQNELAALMAVSPKTVSAIEVGRVEPSISQMQSLAAVLEEPVGYFVGEGASSVESKMARVATELAEIRKVMATIQAKKKA